MSSHGPYDIRSLCLLAPGPLISFPRASAPVVSQTPELLLKHIGNKSTQDKGSENTYKSRGILTPCKLEGFSSGLVGASETKRRYTANLIYSDVGNYADPSQIRVNHCGLGRGYVSNALAAIPPPASTSAKVSDWQFGAVYDAPQYTFVMAVFSYTPVYTVERDVEHPPPGVRRDTPIANLQEFMHHPGLSMRDPGIA